MGTAVGVGAGVTRQGGGGGGVSAAGYDPAADGSVFAWYREDVTDTGSNGTADEWLDKSGNGHHGVLDGAATAAPINASDANFNSRQTLSFVSANINLFHCEGDAASAHKFLHDGTGGWLVGAFRSPSTDNFQPLLATCDRNPNDTGLMIRYLGTTQSLEVYIADGSGTANVVVASATDSVLRDTTYALGFRAKSGESNEWELYLNGSLLISGDYGAAPSSGNPSDVLTIASERPVYSNRFTGTMAEWIFGTGYPDLTARHDYVMTRYGIT